MYPQSKKYSHPKSSDIADEIINIFLAVLTFAVTFVSIAFGVAMLKQIENENIIYLLNKWLSTLILEYARKSSGKSMTGIFT